MGYTRYKIKEEIEIEQGTLYVYEAFSDNHGRSSLVGTFVSLGDPNRSDRKVLASRRNKRMTDKVGFDLVREARKKLEE